MLLHGNSENGDVWYGWVPHLARRYRVVPPACVAAALLDAVLEAPPGRYVVPSEQLLD